MNIDFPFACRPTVATVLARLDGAPRLGRLEVEPAFGVFHGREHRNGVIHVYGGSCRLQGVGGVGLYGTIRTRSNAAAHEILHSRPAEIMPRRSYAAVHERHGIEALDELLPCGNFRSRLRREEIHLIDRSDFSGKFANPCSRDAADSFGPFRRFRNHVITRTHDVVFPGRIGGRPIGHMIAIEADAIRIKEVLVVSPCIDPFVANGDHERGIGAGKDRYPLVGNDLGGLVQPGIDDDDLGSPLATLLQIPRVIPRLIGRPIASEHDMKIARKHL